MHVSLGFVVYSNHWLHPPSLVIIPQATMHYLPSIISYDHL